MKIVIIMRNACLGGERGKHGLKSFFFDSLPTARKDGFLLILNATRAFAGREGIKLLAHDHCQTLLVAPRLCVCENSVVGESYMAIALPRVHGCMPCMRKQ